MAPRTARRWPGRLLWGALALLAFIGFLALGQWQLERRAWKLDLIERVEQRVDAPPVAEQEAGSHLILALPAAWRNTQATLGIARRIGQANHEQ